MRVLQAENTRARPVAPPAFPTPVASVNSPSSVVQVVVSKVVLALVALNPACGIGFHEPARDKPVEDLDVLKGLLDDAIVAEGLSMASGKSAGVVAI